MTGAGVVQSASAIGFETLYAGYRWDNPAPQMYYVRNRFLLPQVGTWNKRDPLGYVGGMALPTYCTSRPLQQRDPTGLWPSVCDCRPETPDATAIFNEHMTTIIERIWQLYRIGLGGLQELIESEFTSIVNGITLIESLLENAIITGLLPGDRCICSIRAPTGLPGVDMEVKSASAMKLCGQCVGTDKLGHMFQQGLQLIQIGEKHGDLYAEAIMLLAEGLGPGNDPRMKEVFAKILQGEFGSPPIPPGFFEDRWPPFDGRVLDLYGPSSPGDIEANQAGRYLWSEMMSSDTFWTSPFDICKYLHGFNVGNSNHNVWAV
jgi:RHS repeat-associated protein